MAVASRRSTHRVRRHGAVLGPVERRTLERAGWRTTLEFRENHVRSLDGRLLRIEQVWTADAERCDGEVVLASAQASSAAEAWRLLLREVEAADVRVLRAVLGAPAGERGGPQ